MFVTNYTQLLIEITNLNFIYFIPMWIKGIYKGKSSTKPFPLISWPVFIVNRLVDTIRRKMQLDYILGYKSKNENGISIQLFTQGKKEVFSCVPQSAWETVRIVNNYGNWLNGKEHKVMSNATEARRPCWKSQCSYFMYYPK